MGLRDILNLHPRDSPEDVIAKIQASKCRQELQILRPRILRMQPYNTVGYVDCLIAYKERTEQLKRQGKYYEKVSETSEEMEPESEGSALD